LDVDDDVELGQIHQRSVLQTRGGGNDMRLSLSIMHEMNNFDAVKERRRIGDETTMTTPPHCLRAHDRGPESSSLGEQTDESGTECGGLHVVGVATKRWVA
jgi:hypothetical protein